METRTIRTGAGRPFRILDGMVLVAATAVGFAASHALAPELTPHDIWQALTEPVGNRPIAEVIGGYLELVAILFLPNLMAWSVALLILGARGWRSRPKGRRRRPPAPGTLACLAVTIVAALTAAFVLIGWALHRADAPLSSWIIEVGFEFMLNEAASAVFWCWVTLALCRRWRAEPTWIDRAGRALGVVWILVGVVPIALMLFS